MRPDTVYKRKETQFDLDNGLAEVCKNGLPKPCAVLGVDETVPVRQQTLPSKLPTQAVATQCPPKPNHLGPHAVLLIYP